MHRSIVTAIGMTLLAPAAGAAPMNIIFYGNSFTGSGGGVQHLVRDIATAAGHETPHIYARVVGGQTLEYHLITGTGWITSQIPDGEHWDAVVMQEHSTRTTSHPMDGNIPAFFAAAQGLYQAVQDHSPDARAVLFETWARQPDNAVYPTIWPSASDMQAEVRMSYDQANALLNDQGTSTVAPVGDAFEAGDFDRSLYSGDLYHASDTGALLISLVLYGTIYEDPTLADIDLASVGTNLDLTDEDRAFAVALAESVLVPAPASTATLATLGLTATRRRRPDRANSTPSHRAP